MHSQGADKKTRRTKAHTHTQTLARTHAHTHTDKEQKIGRARLPNYKSGYAPGWQAIGPPHMRRYLRFEGDPASSRAGKGGVGGGVGALMKRIQVELMQSPAFANLLARLTGMVCLSSKGETRRFRAGLDYTVATYGSMSEVSRLNTVWCLVDDVDDPEDTEGERLTADEKIAMWAQGEIGGFECYIEAEEDAVAEASDVFRMDDDDGPLLQVLARSNTLSIVLQDQRVMRFVKYVGGGAPSSRFDVTVDFEVVQDDDECAQEDGEDGGEEGAGAGGGE
jgi:hypothetical protein